MFCAGQYDIIFAVYDYPPDRVKWCAAEKELWKAYGLSFDNENMRFIFTGPRMYMYYRLMYIKIVYLQGRRRKKIIMTPTDWDRLFPHLNPNLDDGRLTKV